MDSVSPPKKRVKKEISKNEFDFFIRLVFGISLFMISFSFMLYLFIYLKTNYTQKEKDGAQTKKKKTLNTE